LGGGGGGTNSLEEDQRFRLVQKAGSDTNDSLGQGEKSCSVLSQCACACNSGGESPNANKVTNNCGDPDDSSDEKRVSCESNNCICQSQKQRPTSESRNMNGLSSSNSNNNKASEIKPVLKFSVSAILGSHDQDSDKGGLDDDHPGFNPGENFYLIHFKSHHFESGTMHILTQMNLKPVQCRNSIASVPKVLVCLCCA